MLVKRLLFEEYLTESFSVFIINLTLLQGAPMPRRRQRTDAKIESLREQRSLNPHPETVSDPRFEDSDFFDARDLVQVKYEMLRRARLDGETVTDAARAFGLSRPSFYAALQALDSEGLPGLLPRKRGPRGAHKLTNEVLDYVEEVIQAEGTRDASVLSQRIVAQFDVEVHPRSIERALKQREKKRP
jgi:transposase